MHAAAESSRPFTIATLSCLFLGLGAPGGSSVQAAEAPAALTLPAQDIVLHVSIDVPPSMGFNVGESWDLVESVSTGKAAVVPAQIFLAQSDGSSSNLKPVLLARIPAVASTAATRRFELRPVRRKSTERGPAFRVEAVDTKSIGVWEGKRPVFVYNHGVQSKEGVPADRNRSTYLHPIYGLDGEILTDDFPKDHYHHRGLFWAWPHIRIEDNHYSLWDIRGIHQRFERWLSRQAGPAGALVAAENGWYVGEKKVMQERVWIRVYPAGDEGQMLDVDLTWIPTDAAVTLSGAEEKSYGGFTLRFAPRADTVITTPMGNKPDDLAMTQLEWADLSARFAEAARPSGAAVFIAPDHPNYPPTWLTRHYGVLCVGWPGVNPSTFQAGQQIRCRYRLWVHRDGAEMAGTKKLYEGYKAALQAKWEPRRPAGQ